MRGFKVGDRVTLTGGDWSDTHTKGLETGDVVTIQDIDGDGALRFVCFEEDGWWDVEMYGWEVELNTDTPTEHFEKWTPLDTHSGNELHMGQFCYPGVDPSLVAVSPFEQSVRRHTDRIANLLIEKNKAYGDSALNPVRIFSKADRTEQLYTRIDDKISRIQKGTDFANEDTIDDLIGYLFLLKIAKESA